MVGRLRLTSGVEERANQKAPSACTWCFFNELPGTRTQNPRLELTRVILRDIESISYRIALDLAMLEIAGTCDGCPSSPPTTQAEVVLLVTATELERLANQARMQVTRKGEEVTNDWLAAAGSPVPGV